MEATIDPTEVRQWKPYAGQIDLKHTWLPSLPSGWQAMRLKYLTSEPFQYGANESGGAQEVNAPRFVRITDIDVHGNLRDQTRCTLSRELAAPFILEKGDILFARSGATVGKSFLYRESWGEACYAGYLIRFRPRLDRLVPQFVSYFTASKQYWGWIAEQQLQATIQNVSADKYANLWLPLPSLEEQRAIAAFLDRETARIDALIGHKQRLIALLEEKRQAVISHAVTKGLNPDVGMRDSERLWLQNVPEHWEMKPIKHCVRIVGGMTPSKDNKDFWNGTIPWVSPKDMKRFEIDDSEDHISEAAMENTTIAELPIHTVMIVIRGMILARYLPVAINRVPVTINQDMKGLICKPGLIPRYLAYQLRAIQDAFFSVMEEAGHGTLCLRTELWNSLTITIPPEDEQREICDAIDDRTATLRRCIFQIQDSIGRLHEYRTALISAAVTGQIDVRDEVELDG